LIYAINLAILILLEYEGNDNKQKIFGFIKESGRRIVIHKEPFNILDKSAASRLIAFARCLQEGAILADDMFLSLEEKGNYYLCFSYSNNFPLFFS